MFFQQLGDNEDIENFENKLSNLLQRTQFVMNGRLQEIECKGENQERVGKYILLFNNAKTQKVVSLKRELKYLSKTLVFL